MLSNYGEVMENASLEHYNTYGIKTYSKYLVKVDSIDHLLELINYLAKSQISYLVLGKGSNVILPDTPYNGCIISLEKLHKIVINNEEVEVECGVLLSELVTKTIANNLAGFANFATIPGTLGGALVGNASLNKDASLYHYLEKLVVIKDNNLVTLTKDDIKYSYRDSSFKNTKDILVKATFKLKKGEQEKLLKEVTTIKEKRLQTQPKGVKSAGSVFKNPDGYAAGKLIDDLGLKGLQIGDAAISLVHANFIVNLGSSTSKDIKKLIEIIQEKVYNTYGVTLELEQKIIEWD